MASDLSDHLTTDLELRYAGLDAATLLLHLQEGKGVRRAQPCQGCSKVAKRYFSKKSIFSSERLSKKSIVLVHVVQEIACSST